MAEDCKIIKLADSYYLMARGATNAVNPVDASKDPPYFIKIKSIDAIWFNSYDGGSSLMVNTKIFNILTPPSELIEKLKEFGEYGRPT